MEKKNWSIEDLFLLQTPGSMELSPDGKRVVFTVHTVDREEDKSKSRLFLWEGGKSRPLTFSGKDHSPRFSPDGEKLAFLSDRKEKSQIYLLSLEGGEPWQLETEQDIKSFFWHPSGESIIFTADEFCKEESWEPYPGAPENDGLRIKEIEKTAEKEKDKEKDEKKPNKVKVINTFKYRFDGKGYLGHQVQQVYRLKIPKGYDDNPEIEMITGGDYSHSDPAVDPSGRFLAVVANYDDREGMDPRKNILLWDMERGEEFMLYKGPGPIFSLCWSYCGKYLYFAGHDQQEGLSTTSHLWKIAVGNLVEKIKKGENPDPLDKDQAKDLLNAIDRPVGAYVQSEPRAGKGDFLICKEDGVYFLLTKNGVPGLFLATEDDRIEEILYDRERIITGFFINSQGLIFSGARGDKMDELYRLTKGKEQVLTDLNGPLLKEREVIKPREINYPSADGKEIQGWVYYPPGVDNQKFPLLLLIHGGPHGAYGPSFMFRAQFFASKGYVVLLTNPRGSESYGQEFASCIDGDWGNLDYKDIMAGVDAVIKKENIDEENIFAHGWSYGGYMACWLPTQTDRFKAICAGASVSNMLSGYGTSDITLSDEWEYGGRPWENPLHLMEQSPLSHVEKINTPMLLMHGENDMRCPPGQSEEFFVALKRLGKEVTMIRYPEEFHGIKRPKHREDFFNRLWAWFEYFRKNSQG